MATRAYVKDGGGYVVLRTQKDRDEAVLAGVLQAQTALGMVHAVCMLELAASSGPDSSQAAEIDRWADALSQDIEFRLKPLAESRASRWRRT